MARTRRAFTVEFKREAVRQATLPGNTIASFSRDLGMHESVLRRWIQELTSVAAERPVSGMPGNDEQSRELVRLRRLVKSKRVARETIANALGRFGARPQVDHAEVVLVSPSEIRRT